MKFSTVNVEIEGESRFKKIRSYFDYKVFLNFCLLSTLHYVRKANKFFLPGSARCVVNQVYGVWSALIICNAM